MAELALNDVQRHPLASELQRVSVPELMRRKPSPHTTWDWQAVKLEANRGT